MPKFESNMEGPAPSNSRPERSRKDTCGKHREIYRGEAMTEFGTAKAKYAPTPQIPQGPKSENSLQKMRKIGADP